MFRNISKSQESLCPEETYSYVDNKLQNRGILFFSMLLCIISINSVNRFQKQNI